MPKKNMTANNKITSGKAKSSTGESSTVKKVSVDAPERAKASAGKSLSVKKGFANTSTFVNRSSTGEKRAVYMPPDSPIKPRKPKKP